MTAYRENLPEPDCLEAARIGLTAAPTNVTKCSFSDVFGFPGANLLNPRWFSGATLFGSEAEHMETS
jgi:hypothetical protein